MHHMRHPNSDMHLNSLTRFDTTSTIDSEELELRQHAKRLCNEEESWYYYLTEVALRRIGNRIINTFFRQDHRSWLDIKPLLSIALEFDAQVSSWSAHLPPAMQHYETTMTIRAPIIGIAAENSTNYVSRELSWATDNRLLEMRSWLYQPFLYYLIHSGQNLVRPPHDAEYVHARAVHASNINSVLNHPSPPINFKTAVTASAPLTADDMAVLQRMIVSGIECNLKIIDVRSLRHRHHGLWYDLRSTMGAALILLAIVKSGHSSWIPGGLETLWGQYDNDGTTEPLIRGKIAKVLAQFDFWSQESPDLMRHHQVLEEVTSDVRRRVHG